jgi:hypothetical protein
LARKPENTFRASIHKKLPKELHHEKMSNPYRGGAADDWYSGLGGDLWVEYKYVHPLPVRVPIEPAVSGLQYDWLVSRAAEGRNVAVVVGCKDGGVIIRAPAFRDKIPPEEFRARIISRDEIAAWIVSETARKTRASTTSISSKRAVSDVQNRDDCSSAGVRSQRGHRRGSKES